MQRRRGADNPVGAAKYAIIMAMMEKARLRHWDITIADYGDILALMDEWRKGREKHYICFCDANGLAHGWSEPDLQQAYQGADAVFADGVSLKWLAKVSDGKIPKHIMGPVFFEKAMAYGVSRCWRHYFFGGAPGVAETLKAKMEAKYPGVQIVGIASPEFSDDPPPPPSTSTYDFLWVALGCPKQEKWAARHFREVNAAAVLPVGAAFDFHAGTVKLSPMWVQRAGFNWLWRLLTGGKRVWKRNLWCVSTSFLILVKELLRKAFCR